MKWKIGNVNIKNQVCLAPMAGISNFAYMNICEEMGVGYVVTELISAEAIVRGNKKTFEMFGGIDALKIPYAIQLFGSNPETMAHAAIIIHEIHPKALIDINMGCPVPKVAIKNNAGSGLLKNPKLCYDIVKAVVESVTVPVTVKIRSGWDEKNINAIEVALACEQAGAKAIFIHARTRKQGYSGQADWNIIKKVKEAVSIPVIGNGDIKSCYDAKRMLTETNCDAVMIGRGALGNPWLIKECVDYLEKGLEPQIISLKEKIAMMKKNILNLVADKNEYVAVLELRTQLMYYLKGLNNVKELKLAICKATTKDELIKLLDAYEKTIVE